MRQACVFSNMADRSREANMKVIHVNVFISGVEEKAKQLLVKNKPKFFQG